VRAKHEPFYSNGVGVESAHLFDAGHEVRGRLQILFKRNTESTNPATLLVHPMKG
jgi:hypothetical protein